MEIQKMVTYCNLVYFVTDWFISHNFCHVHKSEMSEIILFGGVFLTDYVAIKKYLLISF